MLATVSTRCASAGATPAARSWASVLATIVPQLGGGAGVGGELVRRREEVALDVALGRGRQAERGGVLQRGLVLRDRAPGALGQRLEDLALPQALADASPCGTVRLAGSSSMASAAVALICVRSA